MGAPLPPRLVVTADDLGLRDSVDLGIVRSHREGIVTHASWLAGGDSAPEAAILTAQEAPDLGVGLHLSLSQTRPSGDPTPLASLLTPEAVFPRHQFAAIRWARSRQRLRAVWHEWNAQADAFEHVWGRAPTHLDSHQHVHLAPRLQPLAVRLAVERDILRLRAPVETPRGGPAQFAATAGFTFLGRLLRRRALRASLSVPDHFEGFGASGQVSRSHLDVWRQRLGPGLTEWMVHPGVEDEAYGYSRRIELRALTAE